MKSDESCFQLFSEQASEKDFATLSYDEIMKYSVHVPCQWLLPSVGQCWPVNSYVVGV